MGNHARAISHALAAGAVCAGGDSIGEPLPTTPDPTKDSVLVMKAILETSEYAKANPGGNVIIRAGWEVDEEIAVDPDSGNYAPEITVTNLSQTPTIEAADGELDEVREDVQLDLYAKTEAEVKQLQYEVERLVLENREDPGGTGNNIFQLLFPGNWVNNDELNQAEGLLRRTQIVTLIRHRGI